jgi:hypothetical protein
LRLRATVLGLGACLSRRTTTADALTATVALTSSNCRNTVLGCALAYSRPLRLASSRYSVLAISVICKSKSTFRPTIDDKASRWTNGMAAEIPFSISRRCA